jgi:hypothetical protein
VFSRCSRPTFQRYVLPLSSGWWIFIDGANPTISSSYSRPWEPVISLSKCYIQSAFHEKVPAPRSLWCGSVGGGGSLLLGGLKGCYWWETVWRTRELHYYIQTENIRQLRVACSECTFTVYCGCCDNVLHWITLNSSEHMKYLSVVCSVAVEKILSGWLVTTRHSPRNLAHARISHS